MFCNGNRKLRNLASRTYNELSEWQKIDKVPTLPRSVRRRKDMMHGHGKYLNTRLDTDFEQWWTKVFLEGGAWQSSDGASVGFRGWNRCWSSCTLGENLTDCFIPRNYLYFGSMTIFSFFHLGATTSKLMVLSFFLSVLSFNTFFVSVIKHSRWSYEDARCVLCGSICNDSQHAISGSEMHIINFVCPTVHGALRFSETTETNRSA